MALHSSGAGSGDGHCRRELRLLPLAAQNPTQPAFSARSELVVLHVTVKEKSGAYVTGLSQDALTVLEDGRRQQIQFFGMQDAPVTVGLIIDGSGSMAGVRDRVIAAAGAFAETSNRTDEPRWTPKTGN